MGVTTNDIPRIRETGAHSAVVERAYLFACLILAKLGIPAPLSIAVTTGAYGAATLDCRINL